MTRCKNVKSANSLQAICSSIMCCGTLDIHVDASAKECEYVDDNHYKINTIMGVFMAEGPPAPTNGFVSSSIRSLPRSPSVYTRA